MKERKLEVYLGERFVGTMAQTADRRVAFAYSEEWLDNGFAISPFSLPVEQKVFVPTSQAFSGLWGVFADSLPDAWGQLLVDRMLKARGILSADMTQLERLAIVGDSGMGALSYRPAWNIQKDAAIGDLDELSAQCHAILNHEDAGDLDELFQMGGSSGGARPKIMTDEWIIKFPASDEMKDSGTMEKAYMDCAADCGIIVPETKLMPSSVCAGYFAVKRFDRRKTDGHIERRHMLTAAAILEVDWRTAAMDHHTLMKLTKILSLDNREDLEQMESIGRMRRGLNRGLWVEGILITMASRTTYAREISELLRTQYGTKIKVFDTVIPHSIRAAECSAEGKSIFAYDPKGKVAQAYNALTKEVIQHEKQRQKHRAEIGR